MLEGTDACFAPVLTTDEAPHHPHNKARGTYVEIDGIVQPAPAPRFSRTVPDLPIPSQPPSGPDEAEAALAPPGSIRPKSRRCAAPARLDDEGSQPARMTAISPTVSAVVPNEPDSRSEAVEDRSCPLRSHA